MGEESQLFGHVRLRGERRHGVERRRTTPRRRLNPKTRFPEGGESNKVMVAEPGSFPRPSCVDSRTDKRQGGNKLRHCWREGGGRRHFARNASLCGEGSAPKERFPGRAASVPSRALARPLLMGAMAALTIVIPNLAYSHRRGGDTAPPAQSCRMPLQALPLPLTEPMSLNWQRLASQPSSPDNT
jgi:hypothetical protein